MGLRRLLLGTRGVPQWEEEELATIMKEAQNILTEQDPPAIYYGQQLWYTVLRKEIEGFGWNPRYLSSYHPVRSLKRAAA